jgi:hypothetical protein
MESGGNPFAVSQRDVLDFFAECLLDVCDAEVAEQPLRDELLYTASILSHYALVSGTSQTSLPLANSLREVFDLYVCDPLPQQDPGLMEAAAAQTLMLTGYYGAAMERSFSLPAYTNWGRQFFRKAAVGRRRRLLLAMADHYEPWRDALRLLHARFQDDFGFHG